MIANLMQRLRASEKEAKKGKKKKRVKRGRKEKEIKAEIEEEKSELSAALCVSVQCRISGAVCVDVVGVRRMIFEW